MIPLSHDLRDETVLVFGGGDVGARRARTFGREARVVVVAPEFADAGFGGAERVRAAPSPDGVAAYIERRDPALVVCATDDAAVNDAAAAAARQRGALVNRADRAGGRDAGSVAVPATVADGDVRAAITTSGASPALARHLRERVEGLIAGAGVVADTTGDLRADLRAADLDPDARRDAVRAAVRDEAVWAAARDGGDARAAAARAAASALGDETPAPIADRATTDDGVNDGPVSGGERA
jgi:precorrin-2 dehydrogenase/sirohydrochlorin ferrochelatase